MPVQRAQVLLPVVRSGAEGDAMLDLPHVPRAHRPRHHEVLLRGRGAHWGAVAVRIMQLKQLGGVSVAYS